MASLIVLFSLAAATAADEPATDPLTALHEGNRLFRNGHVEAAVEAYRAGYSPAAPHPTLVYNLGTALHHLERLPEAILWYRRAGGSDDPWLADNLWLARRSLGSQVLPAGGFSGALTRRADVLRWVAVGLAWASLVLVIARPRWPIWALAAALLLGAALYATAAVAQRADCRTDAGELLAGTEAWVRPLADGGFQVAGSGLDCPAEVVALVFPDS